MKTLLASIIIGLLSMSPAFAQTGMDKQKETDQKRYSEQTDEQRQGAPKSDQDRQLKETEKYPRSDKKGMSGDMDKNKKETDQYNRSDKHGMSGDMDKNQKGTDQYNRSDKHGMSNDMDKKQNETDQNRRSEQNGEQSEVLPKYDDDRKVTTDPARPHRAMDVEPQEGYQRITSDLITADDLQGASVYGANNESLADIDEVLMTPEGKVERIVMDVGGFLGMGARSVAIDVNEVDIQKDANDDLRIYIPMNEEELRQMPEYRKDN